MNKLISAFAATLLLASMPTAAAPSTQSDSSGPFAWKVVYPADAAEDASFWMVDLEFPNASEVEWTIDDFLANRDYIGIYRNNEKVSSDWASAYSDGAILTIDLSDEFFFGEDLTIILEAGCVRVIDLDGNDAGLNEQMKIVVFGDAGGEGDKPGNPLYDYEITYPTADDDSFWVADAYFPNIYGMKWIPGFFDRSAFMEIYINGQYEEREYASAFFDEDTQTLTIDFDGECEAGVPLYVKFKAGSFELIGADEEELGENEEFIVTIVETPQEKSNDYSFTYEPVDEKWNNLVKELGSVTFTFTNLEEVEANADGITVMAGEEEVDTTKRVTCEGNKLTVSFNPAITTDGEDIDLTLTIAAKSLTGKTTDATDTNPRDITVDYTVGSPTLYDLTLAFHTPALGEDGTLSATNNLAMLYFVCDTPDLKALPFDNEDLNVHIKELNGDYNQSAHLNIINGLESGKSTFYIGLMEKPIYNGEYEITFDRGAFGNSRWRSRPDMGHTNDTFTIPFTLVDGEERAASPLTLELAHLTTKIVGVKGVPSDDDIYWYGQVCYAKDYTGEDMWKIVVDEFFKPGAETFNMDWVEVFQMTAKKGEQTWWFDGLEPATDYVFFGFGLDDNGELAIPCTPLRFTTPSPVVSNNKFEAEVLSIEPGSDGLNKKVTLSVTTTNDDPYAVVYLDRYHADRYEISAGSEGEKAYLREVAEPLVKTFGTHNGSKTIEFDNVKVNALMHFAIFGYDQDPSTGLTHVEFNTIDENLQAVTLSVNEAKVNDADVTLFSFDLERPYIWGVVTKERAEAAGGIENVHEQINIPIWEAAGLDYYPWEMMARMDLTRQAVDGNISENGKGTLRWDTDYVLYAYTMDDGGYRTSPVYSEEFRTLPREKDDTGFDLDLLEMKSNAPFSPDTFTATLSIKPTDAEKQYALYYGDAYDFETYRNNGRIEEYLQDVFMPRRVKKTYSGDLEFEYGGVYANNTYILMVAGFDTAPTTEPAWILFNSKGVIERCSTSLFEFSADDVFVVTDHGTIRILGDYLSAEVYTSDGRHVSTINGDSCRVAPNGCYIVSIRTPKGIVSKKIIVK